jgi:gluconolactonase
MNSELIKQYSLTGRILTDVPNTVISSNLKDDKDISLDSLKSTVIYPGVDAKLYLGNGALAGVLTIEPNAQIPDELLSSDRFVVVMDGTIEQLIEGNYVTMISRKRGEPDGTHKATSQVRFCIPRNRQGYNISNFCTT